MDPDEETSALRRPGDATARRERPLDLSRVDRATWRRIEGALDALFDLPRAFRRDAIPTAAGGDDAIAAALRALLDADERIERFLDRALRGNAGEEEP